MTFLEQQAHARRATSVLVAEFILALIGMLFVYYWAARFFLYLCCRPQSDGEPARSLLLVRAAQYAGMWNENMFACLATSILVVVLFGGVLRMTLFWQGGAAVVRSFGGRLLDPGSQQFYERRLLNIVSELALSSGVPEPKTYVLLHERGINAFTAGFAPAQSCIAVTRGAMEQLSRNELQGILAHEFSHIRNGDVRLNSWLMIVLSGILGLTVFGRRLMDGLIGCRKDDDDVVPASALFVLVFFVFGLWMRVFGSVGLLAARLIQCSVARQREYFADAVAVQLTRNPLGLANALKRAGTSGGLNAMQGASRYELAHLLFVSARSVCCGELFSSHPPLLLRIRALDPTFDGNFGPWRIRETQFEDLRNTPGQIQRREQALLEGARQGGVPAAAEFLESLPAELRCAVAHPINAAGVLCGLLLDDDAEVRARQRARILVCEGQSVVRQAERWHEAWRSAGLRARRMLSDLAVEGVRLRDPAPRATCSALLRELIAMDGRVTFFEHLLGQRIARRVEMDDAPPLPCAGDAMTGASAQLEASLVLGALAYAGQPDDDVRAQAAWRAGCALLPAFGLGELVPVRESCAFDGLEAALLVLLNLRPEDKGAFAAACEAVIGYDGVRTESERELLLVVLDLLGLPRPPRSFVDQ